MLYSLSHFEGVATVLRDGEFKDVDRAELVPGDILKVGLGISPCDGVLLTGEVVLDESALTGEATPQAKAPIDPNSRDEYDPVLHKRQTISGGTNVIECDDALVLVTRTASYTTQGKLLREILALRRHRLIFEEELPIAIMILTLFSTAYFIYVMFNSSDEPVVAWSLAM